ncbi:tRNA (guanine-N1)-methyltransferase [Acetobacter orientalis NRIC 0481]|nr:tRNA (guanine-N1)-methyltransferase [Acetobacter orientalis NRIC 0481]
MVIRADVADAALSAIDAPQDMPRVFLTPRGYPLRQKDVSRYAQGPGVVLICGRFEGVDERVLKAHSVEQVSIGDYVLSGGETAALVLLDACVRLLPGVMGSDASGIEESFSDGLLEYPHYTRPATWQGQDVPEVLLSGNHAAIAAWRQKQAEEITRERRPDLWSAWLARREKNEAAAGVSGKVRQTGV